MIGNDQFQSPELAAEISARAKGFLLGWNRKEREEVRFEEGFKRGDYDQSKSRVNTVVAMTSLKSNR